MSQVKSNEEIVGSESGGNYVQIGAITSPTASPFVEAAQSIGVSSDVLRFAGSLDQAVAAFDLSGAKTLVSQDDDGATVFEIYTPMFRLFFSVERNPEESGWGLAFHRSSRGGVLASGDLNPAEISSILSLVLSEKARCLKMHAFEGSESRSGLTMRTS